MISFELRTIILLISLLALGIKASYEDLKEGRINNKLLLGFFVIGLIGNLSVSFFELKLSFIINLVFAFFVGFLLWYINFWNAADGKLFLICVSLVPVSLIFEGVRDLYAHEILVYTFVPVFFVFLLFLILQTRKEEYVQTLKRVVDIRTVVNIGAAFFSFQWVMKTIYLETGVQLNLFIGAVILFFVFDGLEKILNIKLIYLFYLASVIRLVIDAQNMFQPDFLTNFLFQLSLFLFFVYFFLYLAYFKFGTHIRIPYLKPGMNLAEKIIKRDDKYTVIPDVKISLFTFLYNKVDKAAVIENKPEGLSRKQIRKIQRWNKAGKMEVGALLIQKRIPYAVFQFIGVFIFIMISVMGWS